MNTTGNQSLLERIRVCRHSCVQVQAVTPGRRQAAVRVLPEAGRTAFRRARQGSAIHTVNPALPVFVGGDTRVVASWRVCRFMTCFALSPPG